MKWYVINTVSGQENKVKEAIQEMVEKKGFAENLEEIFIPSAKVARLSRGKKVFSERKFFPGYVFIKMASSDEMLAAVTSIPKVSNFLGGKKPVAVPDAEIETIKAQLEEGGSMPVIDIMFDVGETVKIIDGAFKSFSGTIESIDLERGMLTVSVSIFGRATPVELSYNQVQKL